MQVDSDSSNVSDGQSLVCELERVLKENPDFKGSFAYSSLLTQAPNPCLNIEGVGLIGLPLSERDAKVIIGHASQAPYGHGDRTLVNTEVRDTWEISPAYVKFANSKWAAFVDGVANNIICPELGATHVASSPRIEFYKLLLYQTGSHFLPHSDTPKVDGMFATMVILLPSQYTGGQVHLNHANEEKVIDFSAFSLLETAALAWYTDVIHEVKPITSGYRLALSYNIVHISTQISRPIVPGTNKAVAELRNVLRKWQNEEYDYVPENDYVAYVLKHKYCKNDLERGVSCLKGEDAHKMLDVIAMAKEMNFSVYMANLEYYIRGTHEQVSYEKRGLDYHADSDTDESTDLKQNLTIMSVTDLDGVFVGDAARLKIDWSCLVPQSPFVKAEPDQEQRENYTGNESSHVAQWYHRAVLILVPNSHIGSFLISVKGIRYAVNKIHDSTFSAPVDKYLINLFASNLRWSGSATYLAVIRLALRWQDFELWKNVTKQWGTGIYKTDATLMSQALKLFGFENIQTLTEDVVMSTCGSSLDKVEVIGNLLPEMAEVDNSEGTLKWEKGLCMHVIEEFDPIFRIDRYMPTFIYIGQNFGFDCLLQLPLLEDGVFFSSLINLARSLVEQKMSLDSVVQTPPESFSGESKRCTEQLNQAGIQVVIDACFEKATARWCFVNNRNYRGPIHVHERILGLLDLVIYSQRMDLCQNLLGLIEKAPGEICFKLKTIYIPLITPLQGLLKKSQINPCSPPFDRFLRVLIENYLYHMLGTTTGSSRQKIHFHWQGCGCGLCQKMGAILTSADGQGTWFSSHEWSHLEPYVKEVRRFISVCMTCSSQFECKVCLTTECMVVVNWDYRVKEAREFLSLISEEVIQEVIVKN
ncbi:hypothetical protein AMATHDRAFT_71092 [Amanita thiersii Skay4041]|uniref:Prolyl 4-hydroxylase alpha subunit Fe(2+) 2OG dioxygenase domain-containing protein n=1 Tax=Amanita thiersii Skay4041 TaxID=703135 RepID=A0A2A9NDC2_9AGAR|nr:hypothetical protein AMATHDRAFT_71092 [Amanita thiersii Skay4041]